MRQIAHFVHVCQPRATQRFTKAFSCLIRYFSDILPTPIQAEEMHLVRLSDAQLYTPPKHTGVKAYRLQGGEGSPGKFCSVGISYYEPDGRADMAAGPEEKIYVVLSGEISVTTAGRETVVLRQFDSCVIAADEAREVRNATRSEAIMLVITPRGAGTSGR
jgi:quercetin dioxygenase-like cupin family protein